MFSTNCSLFSLNSILPNSTPTPERQSNRQSDKQIDRGTVWQTDIEAKRYTDRRINRQTDRQWDNKASVR